MISSHFDHSKGRTVKGVNILNCLYLAQALSIPMAFEIVRKDCLYYDVKTRKVRRKVM